MTMKKSAVKKPAWVPERIRKAQIADAAERKNAYDRKFKYVVLASLEHMLCYICSASPSYRVKDLIQDCKDLQERLLG
jgi:hypothetical protein